ncbi:DUF952 domain-containing protein [Jatrophihabitans sp.]|uniref:DUF952 domain-containing protein n=1 Tax=Jatrophihabitans sp. TaxID=1932789 RepID=UPI0030C70DC7|nr:hypothetical protein [Jatrophihabitans sp.]
MNIFHIVSAADWDAAVAAGSYEADSLATEGFIHFSYAEQVAATANRYYRQLDGLQVLEVDPTAIPAELRIEESPASGEAFPHVYGPVPPAAVVAVHPLTRDAAGDYAFSPGA